MDLTLCVCMWQRRGISFAQIKLLTKNGRRPTRTLVQIFLFLGHRDLFPRKCRRSGASVKRKIDSHHCATLKIHRRILQKNLLLKCDLWLNPLIDKNLQVARTTKFPSRRTRVRAPSPTRESACVAIWIRPSWSHFRGAKTS